MEISACDPKVRVKWVAVSMTTASPFSVEEVGMKFWAGALLDPYNPTAGQDHRFNSWTTDSANCFSGDHVTQRLNKLLKDSFLPLFLTTVFLSLFIIFLEAALSDLTLHDLP